MAGRTDFLFPPPVNSMQLPPLPPLPAVGEISVPSLLMGIPPLLPPQQQQQQPQQHYVNDGFGNFVPTFPPSFYSYAHNLFGPQDAQYMYMTWFQQLQALAGLNGFGFDPSTNPGSRRSNRANAGNASAQFYEDYATEHLQLRGDRRVKLPSAADSMATHSRLNFKKRPTSRTVRKSEDGRDIEVEETVNLNRSNNHRGMHLHSAKKIAQQQRQQQRMQRARDGFEKFHEGDQDGDEEGIEASDQQQSKRPRRANAGRPMQRALASLNEMEVDEEAEIAQDEIVRDSPSPVSARSTRKRSRPSTAAASEIDLGEIEEEDRRPPSQGRKRSSAASKLSRNASLQSFQQVQVLAGDAMEGENEDSDEESDDPDDDPELDLRQPRRRRLFVDFTALSNNTDTHSSRNSPSKSSSATKEEYYVYGTTHGKLLNAAARRSFFIALQAPDSFTYPDQEHTAVTATTSTSRRRQAMISRVGDAPVQRQSRVGDEYQAAIPAWRRPRRPSSASSTGRSRSGSFVPEESGLIWSPLIVKGTASTEQKDNELQSYLDAAMKIEREKRCGENANNAPFAAGEICFAMLPAENDGEVVETIELVKDFRLCTILGPTYDPTPAPVVVEPEPVDAKASDEKSVARRLSRQRKAAPAPSITAAPTIPNAAAMKACPIWMRVYDGIKVHVVHERDLLRPGDILREEIHLQLLAERQGDIKATLKTLKELPGLVAGPEEQLFVSERWTCGDAKKFCAAIRRFNDHPRKIWQSQFADNRNLRDVLAFFLSVQPRLMQAAIHPASRLLSIYRRSDRAIDGLGLDDNSNRDSDEDGDEVSSEGDAGQAVLTEDDRYYRVSSVPITTSVVKSTAGSTNGSEAGDTSSAAGRSRGRPRGSSRQRRESEPADVQLVVAKKLQESIEDESSTAPEDQGDDDVSVDPYPADHFRRTTRSNRPSTAGSIPTVESIAIKGEEQAVEVETFLESPRSRPRSSNPVRGSKAKNSSSPGHQLLWSEAEAAFQKRRGTSVEVDEIILDDDLTIEQEVEEVVVTSDTKNKRAPRRRSTSKGRKSNAEDSEDNDPDTNDMQVESSVITDRRKGSRSNSSADTSTNTSNPIKIEVKKEIMASTPSAAAAVAMKVSNNRDGVTASHGHYGLLAFPDENDDGKSGVDDTAASVVSSLPRKRGRPPRSTTPPHPPANQPPLPPVLSAGAIAAIKASAAAAGVRSNSSNNSVKSKVEKEFKPCFCPRRFNDTDRFLACAAGHACAGWVHLKCAGLHTATEKTLQRCINFVCRGCRDAGADGVDDDAMELESD